MDPSFLTLGVTSLSLSLCTRFKISFMDTLLNISSYTNFMIPHFYRSFDLFSHYLPIYFLSLLAHIHKFIFYLPSSFLFLSFFFFLSFSLCIPTLIPFSLKPFVSYYSLFPLFVPLSLHLYFLIFLLITHALTMVHFLGHIIFSTSFYHHKHDIILFTYIKSL